jgi:ABC-type multidrug transport system fused ATPase/permease subunit
MATEKKTQALTSTIQETSLEEERPKPTYAGLFRFYTHSDLPLLIPALATSIASGILIPAFTILLGRIFTQFGNFSSGLLSSDQLEHEVTLLVIGVCIVGAAAWALGWAHMSLWLAFGENTAKRARERVLKGLLEKSMTWYDQKVTNNGVSGNMNKAVKYDPQISN